MSRLCVTFRGTNSNFPRKTMAQSTTDRRVTVGLASTCNMIRAEPCYWTNLSGFSFYLNAICMSCKTAVSHSGVAKDPSFLRYEVASADE